MAAKLELSGSQAFLDSKQKTPNKGNENVDVYILPCKGACPRPFKRGDEREIKHETRKTGLRP